MSDDKKKKAMDILVAFGPSKGKKPEDSPESEEEEYGGALEDAMGELIAAMKAGDNAAAAQAFKDAMDLC